MDNKSAINEEEVVKKLRDKYIAYMATGNHNSAALFRDAADVIEQYRSRNKFDLFIWNALGRETMDKLIDMYREQGEEK